MSSKIYELFGFPLEDQGRTANELVEFFNGTTNDIPAGVCSILSNTTDLNLRKPVSQVLKEVNLLSLRYADTRASGLHQLEVDNLFAGQIPVVQGDTESIGHATLQVAQA